MAGYHPEVIDIAHSRAYNNKYEATIRGDFVSPLLLSGRHILAGGNMDYSYEITNGGVRIQRVNSPMPCVAVPEEVEGYPVTELGPYALSGTLVEELYLPSHLKKIGAYAFYNCEKLRHLSCYGRAVDLGAGLFAGTGSLESLDITLFDGEKSCLKELLSELRQTLRVRVHQSQTKEARLIFPEYFEESVENTPARILFVETHGCGHRYRYCFVQSQFQYSMYDGLFPHIIVQEPEPLVTELALGRLQYPLGLSPDHEQMYRGYVAEHWKTAGFLLICANRPNRSQSSNLEAGGIPWLVQNILQPHPLGGGDTCFPDAFAVQLHELACLAQKSNDTETVSWIMDYRHKLHIHDIHQKGGQLQVKPTRRFSL